MWARSAGGACWSKPIPAPPSRDRLGFGLVCGMTWVTLMKRRVRAGCTRGSVRAKADRLSYPNIFLLSLVPSSDAMPLAVSKLRHEHL